MSNVFGSTDSMLQNLSQARSQLQDANVNVLEDKEKPELIGKTLGEAKTFITGSSIVKAVGPKLKKYVIQKVKGRVQEAKGQLEDKIKKALKGKEKPTDAPPDAPPAATDATETATGTSDTNFKQESGQSEGVAAERAPPADPVAPVKPVAEDMPLGATADEIDEAAGRATINASGEAVAKGLPKGAGGATQGGDIESLGASDAPLTSSQASQFTSTPELGAEPDLAVAPTTTTSASGGIAETSFGTAPAAVTTESASGGLAETSFGAAGRAAASKIGTDTSAITEESMNAGRGAVSESGISDTLNAVGRGAYKLLDGARQVIFGAKQAATGAAKTAGETAAEIGGDAAAAGGETALGILDSIPGADIIGVIGGAILTGIEAHRHKKMADAISRASNNLPNFSVSTQLGSFGN
jgi:hypothetical protein